VPAACSISGVFDLTPLVHTTMAQDLQLDDAEARKVSPQFWPAPKGRSFDSMVGALESSEFIRQSREIAEIWGKAGVATRFQAVEGMNHFTVADPLADPQSPMVARLVELTKATQRQ
jgi:arylformamidase